MPKAAVLVSPWGKLRTELSLVGDEIKFNNLRFVSHCSEADLGNSRNIIAARSNLQGGLEFASSDPIKPNKRQWQTLDEPATSRITSHDFGLGFHRSLLKEAMKNSFDKYKVSIDALPRAEELASRYLSLSSSAEDWLKKPDIVTGLLHEEKTTLDCIPNLSVFVTRLTQDLINDTKSINLREPSCIGSRYGALEELIAKLNHPIAIDKVVEVLQGEDYTYCQRWSALHTLMQSIEPSDRVGDAVLNFYFDEVDRRREIDKAHGDDAIRHDVELIATTLRRTGFSDDRKSEYARKLVAIAKDTELQNLSGSAVVVLDAIGSVAGPIAVEDLVTMVRWIFLP